jgi:hypothetical protein
VEQQQKAAFPLKGSFGPNLIRHTPAVYGGMHQHHVGLLGRRYLAADLSGYHQAPQYRAYRDVSIIWLNLGR